MRRLIESIMNEGVDLRCPNCGDNLGKATENPKKAWCGTCGTGFKNPRGVDDYEDEKLEPLKKVKTSDEAFRSAPGKPSPLVSRSDYRKKESKK